MKTQKNNIRNVGEISQHSGSDQTMITSLQATIKAHTALPSPDVSPSAASLSGLWLGHMYRTASHELGHVSVIAVCTMHVICKTPHP